MNVTVIGVAGGTGSGKSTLVKRLQEAFKEEEVVTLCHDYYYKAHPELTYEERTKLNYDHPQSFDTDMLVEHIRTLKNNVPIEHPVYSFVDHNRTAETVLVKPSKVIIVDGILIFENKELRDLMDIKVYVDTDADIRLARRILRDVCERGRTMQSVISFQFRCRKHVDPQHPVADQRQIGARESIPRKSIFATGSLCNSPRHAVRYDKKEPSDNSPKLKITPAREDILAGVKTLESDLSDTLFHLFSPAQGKRILFPLHFGDSSLHVSGSGRIPLRKDRYVIVFERYDNTPATVQYSESEQPGRIGNSRRGMPEFSARVHLIDLIVDQRFAGNVEQGTGPGSEILPFSDPGRSERRVLHPIVNTR